MVGRRKKTKICDKGSSQGSQEDRISQLPDHLIYEILYYLTTNDAVRTSVLSTRWTSLWKCVPGLDLDYREFSSFNALLSFFNSLFDIRRESSWIRKFQLHMNVDFVDAAGDDVSLWIDFLTRHNIQHLDLHFGNAYFYLSVPTKRPLSIYTCKTLLHLRLFGANLANAEFVSLPCLKTIHLEYVIVPNEATLEKLISGSPVLEDLTIITCRFNKPLSDVLQVRSQTLKRIHTDLSATQVVIDDAPLLQFLRVHEVNFTKCSFKIICPGFSAKVHIDAHFRRAFDPWIYLYPIFLFVFLGTYYKYSKVEPLPQFSCMSRLCVSLCVCGLRWLPTFLESAPNLKSLLVMKVAKSILISLYIYRKSGCYSNDEERDQISFSAVHPKCLLSSLEFVDIQTRIPKDATEMKRVRYLLDNSAILKKLTLRLDSHPTKHDVYKELLRIPIRSVTCQVLVL
ncbi:F-box/FBD/LRR-repeat protein At1g51370 [Eutrema salsugineum]|uniref:F-box/FBD/LRR-repeat protein At1g51370 n=1 Tax=Eutrema salsugineum TaxID=72664 RepID=UPI000CED0204|nr:F-box/FBD/LRR-repeat protein At1g51370 [Eutrema salsugineum]